MLLKFLGRYRDAGLLILRIGLGAAFMIHGLPKLTGGPKLWASLGKNMGLISIDFLPVFWGFMAAFTEGIGGVLLVLGAFYRPVCLLLTFTMFIATLTLASPKDRDFKTYSNPLKLAVVFFGLAFIGPGRFSIDKD
ncbi:MAG: DoxX family protein [Verrucomicrobia bacterium]|jgi:putative oxidoreductase|nr:MAG: DoxX family protein [Verrucomicrobiota bacterium]